MDWQRPPASIAIIRGSFGSKSYAREELVAEMAGAFVCASLGIVPTVRHADYIGSWLEVLREDNRAVVRAASAASKAADFLLAFLPPAIDSGRCTDNERRPRDGSAPNVSRSSVLTSLQLSVAARQRVRGLRRFVCDG